MPTTTAVSVLAADEVRSVSSVAEDDNICECAASVTRGAVAIGMIGRIQRLIGGDIHDRKDSSETL